MTDFTELSIDGRVATPGDADWDEARLAWNLAADQHPSAVAFVESAEDVAKTVALRRRERPPGRRPGDRPRRRRRSAPLEDTILIKTERMRGIEVDPERADRPGRGRRARRSSWARRRARTASARMPGSSPDVGVVGYTLGGGLSWLGRAARLRLQPRPRDRARHRRRRAAHASTPRTTPDLFWALRGGGGGYAIVTALHLDLLPIAEIYAGALLFPAEVGAEAVRAYRDWAATVSGRRHLGGPLRHPAADPRRARAAARHAAADDRRRLHRHPGGGRSGVRAAARDRRDDHGHLRPDAGRRPLPDPHGPREPGARRSATASRSRELPDEAIDAFVGLAGPGSGSPLLLSELRQLGGALGRPAEDGGALTHLDAAFVMYSVGDADDARSWARRSPATWRRSTRRWSPGPPRAATSTSPSAPATSTRSSPPTSAPASPRSSASGTPTGRIVANHAVSLGEADSGRIAHSGTFTHYGIRRSHQRGRSRSASRAAPRKGPRSRPSLASRADRRGHREGASAGVEPPGAEELRRRREAGRGSGGARAGRPSGPRADRELARGSRLDPTLRRTCSSCCRGADEVAAPRATQRSSVAEWMAPRPEERGSALVDLLLLADALPRRRRPRAAGVPAARLARASERPGDDCEPSRSRSKVVAIHEALRRRRSRTRSAAHSRSRTTPSPARRSTSTSTCSSPPTAGRTWSAPAAIGVDAGRLDAQPCCATGSAGSGGDRTRSTSSSPTTRSTRRCARQARRVPLRWRSRRPQSVARHRKAATGVRKDDRSTAHRLGVDDRPQHRPPPRPRRASAGTIVVQLTRAGMPASIVATTGIGGVVAGSSSNSALMPVATAPRPRRRPRSSRRSRPGRRGSSRRRRAAWRAPRACSAPVTSQRIWRAASSAG